MITNEMAGSGAMPCRGCSQTGIGPLIGTRTWVCLVGHYTNPIDLLDGGFTGTQNLAFYNTNGSGMWRITASRRYEWNIDRGRARRHDPHWKRPSSGDGTAEEEPGSAGASASALSQLPQKPRPISSLSVAGYEHEPSAGRSAVICLPSPSFNGLCWGSRQRCR